MEYTKYLQDKLNLAYDLIFAYQKWFNKNHLLSIEDKTIKDATDKLLELRYEIK